ncbi:DUF4233 domain-containing protein [Catellatospora citrea]|uniref:DUF4233 domain-containing protein n=1 Tax=Catellatospora citrea TaxID=53366 RepID=A0A8J3KIK2_9ACTN|nr:DUF4233 domain-containing protein [Catellatospora citrea]RKE07597.1 uncharacterized protein DUF4233 [Catellatospora citrea]GIF95754.1 hypothetical protein Cci01nite_08480 [Catellatospora citrea]
MTEHSHPSEAAAGSTPEGPAGHKPGEARERDLQLSLGGKPSGLRNPTRAVRGLAAGTLVLEALVLLLALMPIWVLRPPGGNMTAVTVALVAVVVSMALTATLRFPWGWWLVSAFQVALLLLGFLHWAFAVVGVVFGLTWAYVLYVRRTITG